jgi:RND family efflux transporter MFP subunit
VSGCSAPEAKEVRAATLPEVQFVTVRTLKEPAVVELPGSVVAVKAATLTAPVAGRVRAIAEEGAMLAPNAEAALLDPIGLPAQVEAAAAARDAAERRRASAQTGVQQAEIETNLTVATLEQSLRSAEAERDRRRAALRETQQQAQTEPARLRAQVEAAKAHVRQLKSGDREQRIQQLIAGLEVARKEQGVALTRLNRQQQLFQRGLVSEAEVEITRLDVQRTNANVIQREKELELSRQGQHPELIQEAEHQVEAAEEALRQSDGLKEAVAQRQAELAAAEAEVAKATRNLETARANRLAIAKAKQEAQASEAEARRFQVELSEAKSKMARASVRAPFAGQVVRRRVRPDETVVEGGPLLEIVDPRRLRFEASVSESDLSRVARGQRLAVSVSALPRPLSGRVVEVIQSAEAAKQAYTVKIDLDSIAGLRPGMVGTARFTLQPAEAHTRLPLACLRRHFPRENRAEVLVLEGGRPVVRPVQLAAAAGAVVTVKEGLREGDRVVVSETAELPLNGPLRTREVGAP